jgi:LemA protein
MDLVGLILFVAPLIVLGWGVVSYNRLVTLLNQVKNGWRQIDVQLKRRHDLIPNLVETIKDYMAYEQETLQKVIQARNQALGAQAPEETVRAEGALTGALGRLFALMERYPDLKANESVSRLTEELTATENKIAFARQFYNDSVMSLNTAVQSFPSSLVATLFNFHEAAYFQVPEQDTAVPAVDLR